MELTLDTAPQEDTGLTLDDTNNAGFPVQGSTARNRALRNHLAMAEGSPGVDQIENSIVIGQEQDLRKAAAAQATLKAQEQAVAEVRNLAETGRATKEQAAEAVQKAINLPPQAPETVMEEKFADRFLDIILRSNTEADSPAMQAMAQSSPEEVKKVVNAEKTLQIGTEVARRAHEDVLERVKKLGYFDTAWNVVETMVPFASAIRKSPDWSPSNILQPGSSVDQERGIYWDMIARQDFVGAKKFLEDRIASIEKSNPMDAVTFVKDIISQGSDDKFATNFLSTLDLDLPGSVVAVAGKAAIGTIGLRKLLRAGAGAIGEDGVVDAAKIASATGDLSKAAKIKSARTILMEKDPTGANLDLSEMLPNIVNPGNKFKLDPGNLEREATQRITAQLERNAQTGVHAITKSARAQRVPEEVVARELDVAEELVKLQHPSIQDSVLDVRLTRNELSNSNFAEVVIGRRDGTLFRSATQAENYAKNEYGLDFQSFSLTKDETGRKGTNLQPRNYTPEEIKKMGEGLNAPTPSSTTEVNALFKKKYAPEKVKGMLESNELLVTRINKTIADPIDSKRDPSKMTHLKEQKVLLEKEIADQKKFLSAVERISNPGKAEIVQQGNGYYISIKKPLNETDVASRELLLTTNNVNPVNAGEGFLKALLLPFEKFRSAEDLLSRFQRDNRHLVTHAPQEVQRLMVEMAKPIGKLRKSSRDSLKRVLEVNKNFIDKTTGERGKAFGSQTELEINWMMQNGGKRPTEKESLAYWTYHQIMDVDWVMRNFGVHRDLSRQGVESYSIPVKLFDEKGVPTGEKIDVSLYGRFEKQLPEVATGDPGVLVLHDGKPQHFYLNSGTKEEKDHLRGLVESQGYQVVQVANPTDRVFKEHAGVGRTVNYVLTKEHKVSPLPMNLVDYSPGVHVMYPHPFFVKQPVIETTEKGIPSYFGDKTILAAWTPAEAKRLSKALNDVKDMIKRGADDAELNAYITKHLPNDAKYWKQVFKTHLSLDQPIGEVRSSKSFWDTHGHLKPEKLRNEKDAEQNLFKSIDMDFMADRNGPINSVVNKGTLEQPVYKTEVAETLDPFVAMNRTLGNSIRSVFLNDYKIGAIEQWVAQNAHLLANPDSAKKNPFQAFYNPVFNKGVTDAAAVAAANNTRERIVQFLGVKSDLGKELSWAQTKLLDSMGETKARAYTMHELKAIKDPVAFLRSVMFDMRFGFFNIKQFIVQSQGFAHIMALTNPVVAAKSMAAFTLQRYMSFTDNPDVINKMASIATTFGWKKEHFTESYQIMRNSGFDIVGREHALRNESFDPELLGSTWGAMLEWGRKPFVEGERLVRMMAWNAAYHEFRKANPTKTIKDADIGSILTRADDLSVNMTKASHSSLQEGVASVPTQFYTFSHRMINQFWGGRLSKTEKAKALATQAFLYGIPVAAGAAIPWPFYDSIKKKMQENGSEMLDNQWIKFLMSGFMEYATQLITGTEYNVASRYGPGFSDAIAKALGGDASGIEMVFGATGTFLESIARAAFPLHANAKLLLSGKSNSLVPIQWDDVGAMVREISSVNDFYNSYTIMNTGKYFSKAGNWVGGDAKGSPNALTGGDAIAQLLGLQQRKITDASLKMGSLKDQAEFQRAMQARAKTEMRIAFKYASDHDFDKYTEYMKRARIFMEVIGSLRDEQIMQAYKEVVEENKSMVDKVNRQFAERGYKSQLPARLQRLFEGKY